MVVGADRPRWLKETDDTNELEWLRQVLHMLHANVRGCACVSMRTRTWVREEGWEAAVLSHVLGKIDFNTPSRMEDE